MAQSAPPDDDEFVVEAMRFEMLPHQMYIVPEEGKNPHLVSAYAAICYCTLLHLGADKRFRISRKKIAARMGKSVRSVQNYLDELVSTGWIVRTPVYNERGRMASRYSVRRTPVTPETE